jgi:hypothetical protein
VEIVVWLQKDAGSFASLKWMKPGPGSRSATERTATVISSLFAGKSRGLSRDREESKSLEMIVQNGPT